jgi:hypothetical protein
MSGRQETRRGALSTDFHGVIAVEIRSGDVLKVKADILALKSGARLHGAADAVAEALKAARVNVERRIGKATRPVLIDTRKQLGVDAVLFQPAPDIEFFDYRDVRNFARDTLASIAQLAPTTETIAITLQGPGVGLDVREAFEAEIGGLIESVNRLRYPPALRRILFVERAKQRAERMRGILRDLLPRGMLRVGKRPGQSPGFHAGAQAREATKAETAGFERLREAGVKSRNKPLVFVAMPFAPGLSDVFEYGIINAVKKGLGRDVLCERADLASFVGDVMQHVRDRISGAVLVIADLTGANANVYLEIGFAWGTKRPTVLIVRSTGKDVKFDVRNQRYLEYGTIKDLETKLARELKALKSQVLAG